MKTKKKAAAAKKREPAAVWVPVADLVQWVKNPRDNDRAVDFAVKSIETYGWGAPLVARKANREIIAGHTRIKAALKLGIKMVPVRYMDLTAKQAHAYAIADNKIGEIATWVEKGVVEVLREVGVSTKEDLGDLGFREKEAAKYSALVDAFDALPADKRGVDEDEVPEAPKVPVTKPGDIWALGSHRIICGSCRELSDVKKLLASLGTGTLVHVAITSPPYASQRKYDESSGFKPIRPDEFVEWFKDVQENVAAVLAHDGSWFVNIKEHCDDGQRVLYVKDLTLAHARSWEWLFVDEFCWRNTKNGTPGGWPNRMKNAWEPVFHFAKQQAIKFRVENVSVASSAVFEYSAETEKSGTGSGLLGERASEFTEGMARPSNVVECAAASESLHSAAFPVALPEFFVKAFSDVRDVIFDPFMGSGTTLIACEKTGRVAVGTEISPAYCDVIVARWEKYTGKKATRTTDTSAMKRRRSA